jgi:hypothetical protein
LLILCLGVVVLPPKTKFRFRTTCLGGSAMRYHIDPDQGVLWGYDTAVVSVGATRRFAFRPIAETRTTTTTTWAAAANRPNLLVDDEKIIGNKPHVFVLMNGDVTEMFNDCQDRFQHSVKTAEDKGERAPRVSLVFKKTLATSRESLRTRISL